jgi:hypothetical protein
MIVGRAALNSSGADVEPFAAFIGPAGYADQFSSCAAVRESDQAVDGYVVGDKERALEARREERPATRCVFPDRGSLELECLSDADLRPKPCVPDLSSRWHESGSGTSPSVSTASSSRLTA